MDPANSSSILSNSPLFRTQKQFLLGYLEFALFRTLARFNCIWRPYLQYWHWMTLPRHKCRYQLEPLLHLHILCRGCCKRKHDKMTTLLRIQRHLLNLSSEMAKLRSCFVTSFPSFRHVVLDLHQNHWNRNLRLDPEKMTIVFRKHAHSLSDFKNHYIVHQFI